jgi:glycosyltransferase involved in cell wall biosynthesis
LISIVIPAHNEEQVIGRLLEGLVGGADPGELEIVVVTNGCTDRTADVAAAFPGVTVVDSPVASKPAALNLGDATATSFPRMYLDADIEVDATAVRAVDAALRCGEADLAAPKLHLEVAAGSWAVRAFYDVWTRLPFVQNDLVGGFYGLSEAARSRFDDFPDTMAEDFYVHSLVPASRRLAVPGHVYVVHPPLTLRGLVRIQTRIQAANRRDRALFAEEAAEIHAGHVHALLRMARRPRMLPHVAVYGGVMVLAKARSRWKNRSKAAGVWDRDTRARAQAGAK